MIHAALISSLKYTTKFSMKTANISTTQESSHVENINEITHHFLRYQGYCSFWIRSARPISEQGLLCGNIEVITWRFALKKGLDFGPSTGFSSMTVFQITGALCQAVSGTKIYYWNGTTTLLPWFGSEWLIAVSKNKVCLKGTKMSRYWRHKICDDGTESYSTTGVPKLFPTVAASLN
jgi:hypothetical protein